MTHSISAEGTSFDNDPHVEAVHQNMIDAGESIEDLKIIDTWSYNLSEEWVFPDGIQKIYFKRMNEGEKAEFQKRTNKDIRVQRSTGDAKLSVDPASERHILIMLSVTDWKLYKKVRQGNREVMAETKFDQKALKEWMEGTNPKYVQELEKAIRESNEWMAVEASVDALEKERENLDERIKAAKEQEKAKS